MHEVFILSAVRTPIGKFGGSLAALTAADMGVVAAKAAMERAGVRSPSDSQCTAAAPCDSISGNASSLIAATTTSYPCALAASSTRKGNLPFPAMSPSFSLWAGMKALDEREEPV